MNGGVVYNVAYALVTVTDGASVNESNSAFAIAHCMQCTTVAISFQVILIVGQSNEIAPINVAGALNYKCPACMTTALADQLVVTLKAQPSAALSQQLENTLAELDALPLLGRKCDPGSCGGAGADRRTADRFGVGDQWPARCNPKLAADHERLAVRTHFDR